MPESDYDTRAMNLVGELAELAPDQRDQRLQELCGGDSDLRSRVVTLLKELNESDRTSDATSPLPQPSSDPRPPVERIGPYRLLKRIGVGGMGEVYEAEQDRPRRRVAIKLIHPLQMSPTMLRRFEFEAEILGRLDHPGVAHVYEAGTAQTPFGPQPYFAMELVRGLRLDLWARTRQPSLQQRLQMLMDICDAVQHAHQHGVIHRDLKPSNILVTDQNEPRILDFGVATALKGESAAAPAETLHTVTGQIVGTLQYMSPEQVAGDVRSLDTRSDVYALGVIAYQLLSDRLPYDVSDKTIPEALRVIQDEQPSRLGTINRELRGDLETIVFKALAKEKQQRYASCAELGADVKRYLSYEPITARPPSLRYQLGKFAKRHKVLVGAALVTVIALVGGITVATLALIDARRSRQIAVERQLDAETALLGAEQSNRFLNSMLASVDPRRAQGKEVTVREVLDRASQVVANEFTDQPVVEAQLRVTMGRTYHSLGENPTARDHLTRAVELLKDVLGDDHSYTLDARNNLALVLDDLGQTDQAERVYRQVLFSSRKTLGNDAVETLTSINNLACNLDDQSRWDEAQQLHREALQRRRRALGEAHPDTLQSMHNLGSSLQLSGRPLDAMSLLKQAAEQRQRLLGPNHPSSLASVSSYANALSATGHADEAEPLLRDALERSRRVLGENHPATYGTASRYVRTLMRLDRLAEAESLCREQLDRARQSLGDDAIRVMQLTSLHANLLLQFDRAAEAEPVLTDLLERTRRMSGVDHANSLIVQAMLGAALNRRGEFGRSEPLLRDAAMKAHATKLSCEDHCMILLEHAAALSKLDEHTQAKSQLVKAKDVLTQGGATTGDQMRRVLGGLGDTCVSLGLPVEAAAWRAELAKLTPATAPATQSAGNM